jgi:hypothetical protein
MTPGLLINNCHPHGVIPDVPHDDDDNDGDDYDHDNGGELDMSYLHIDLAD